MNYDFIIIGSGPAGSILSLKLANEGFKIALVDRAKNKNKSLINDFFCPYINKLPEYYTPVFSDQLGGNSALWHGKIYLISEREFKEDSWGFKYEELKFFSDNLATDLNIDKKKLTKILNEGKNIFHYSFRSNLKNIFNYLNLETNNNINIYKGFSPIKLNFDNKKVVSLEMINEKKQKKNLSIKHSIIFCAGGLGNPHMLLKFTSNKK